MKLISIHVPEKLLRRMKTAAARRGMSMSELLRLAVEEHLKKDRTKRPSMLDIPPISCGPPRRRWTKSEFLDEQIRKP